MLDWYNPVFLSRVQFAFVISFHIIFPALTIGLASWLAVLEALWLKTKHPIYKEIFHHWVKIFSVCFGMGVVSGVVMSYQFGTNWSEFSYKAGNVIGPLLAFEVLTAFFLEASFLGVMLFGWDRVSERAHFFATLMVAIGTCVSSFWILSVNSWMHTPAGFIKDASGVFLPASWMEIIFNPSFLYRLTHMLLAAYLSTAFFAAAVSAGYLLKKKHIAHARVIFAMSMFIVVSLTPLQIIAGHAHGINTLKHQPVKVAAMEGIWDSEHGAPFKIIGWPDSKAETTRYSIEIPYASSLVLTNSLHGKVRGLKEWERAERPPVLVVFWSFRIMLAMATLMLLVGIIAVVKYLNKTLFKAGHFHKFCMIMGPSGLLALLAGWVTTEVGRQPWVIYNHLLTKNAASAVSAYEVSISLLAFILVYSIVFSAGIFYIFKLIKKGPKAGDWHDDYGTHGLAHPLTIYDIFLGHK